MSIFVKVAYYHKWNGMNKAHFHTCHYFNHKYHQRVFLGRKCHLDLTKLQNDIKKKKTVWYKQEQAQEQKNAIN